MHVKMRGAIEDAVAQHPSRLWIRLRRRHLKLRAVVLRRNIGGDAVAWREAVSPHQRGCATTVKDIAARPVGARGMPGRHDAGLLPVDFCRMSFSRASPGCRDIRPWSLVWSLGQPQ